MAEAISSRYDLSCRFSVASRGKCDWLSILEKHIYRYDTLDYVQLRARNRDQQALRSVSLVRQESTLNFHD